MKGDKMNISLKDKVIVVSGGTKGVGKDTVIKAAKIGAKVVFSGRDKNAAKNIIEEVIKINGEADFVETDLSNPEDCEKLFQRAVTKYGKIDGFLNYAGVTDAASLLETTPELIDKIFDINVRAAILCSKLAIKEMIKNNGGSIVLIGSPHAWAGEEDRVAYACSKGSIITLSNHISKHYAKYNIRSNYITMGWTPTEGELQLRKNQGISETELREMAGKVLPTGRMTEVEEITSSILFLLSDNSNMVSGSNIRITGGWFL
jgi:NAD(P)-dependent dehydrogenase (short-subunit alcohol dehydrogenase family)